MAREFFKSFNILTEQEIEEIVQLFEERKIAKNEIFLEEGDKCWEIAFVRSGVFRSYYTSGDGKDSTYCFRFPGDLLASYSSFISGRASSEAIQAISDTDLLVLKKSDILELEQSNPNWTRFLKAVAEQEYLELEKRFFQLQRENASQRYLSLIENQPGYVQNIPLHYLASYLGITQRHLSRIRKDISF